MKYPRINIIDIGRPGWRSRRLARTVAIATAFTLPMAVWGVAGSQIDNALASSSSPAAVTATAASRVVGGGQDSYAPVVDAVAPAVVTIHAEHRAQPAAAQQLPFPDDPLFREFFGNRMPRGGDEGGQPRGQGLGSGVLVSADGYILTNHHVIDNADRVTVELTDRRTFTAKVVGSDAPSDLAVLKIDGTDLPSVPLGNSDEVRVGDVVLAIGNPMGVGQTVTMGIVSAKRRATGLGDGSFEDFIQTDAPINRGNSGGALVSTRGELVGINSQILSPSGGNIGIGFAIPANMATHVMQALMADGRVHRGMLGVTVQPLTGDIASSLGMAAASGGLISSVREGGPADKAGVKRGDVVIAIEGRPVIDANHLRNRIAATKPGSRVSLTVLRAGKERTLTATLEELPSAAPRGDATGADPDGDALGLRVQPVPPDQARTLGLEAGEGLLVAGVSAGSAAADAGFRAGDVIEEVNGRAIGSVADLRQAVSTAGDRPALVLVRRGEQPLYLTLSPRQ